MENTMSKKFQEIIDRKPKNDEERLERNNRIKRENKKRVVYVTGCLGFIGAYVTRACLEKGWYVRGVDNMTYA